MLKNPLLYCMITIQNNQFHLFLETHACQFNLILFHLHALLILLNALLILLNRRCFTSHQENPLHGLFANLYKTNTMDNHQHLSALIPFPKTHHFMENDIQSNLDKVIRCKIITSLNLSNLKDFCGKQKLEKHYNLQSLKL